MNGRLQQLHILFREKLIDMVNDETRAVLKKILHSPLRLEELPSDKNTGIVIKSLVRHNILQYSCSEYTGIYEWAGVGGGECFPDVIAPSNRIQYLALCGLYGRDNPRCRYRLSILGIP